MSAYSGREPVSAMASETPRWFSEYPSKHWGEKFFLCYSVGWIFLFGGVVATKVYMDFGDVEYMLLGLAVSLPAVIVPLLLPGEADRSLPVGQRYWVKANIWVAIYSYIGNYFWTHYFFSVIGAAYTFPITWNLNGVPIALYLITHAYFLFYHTTATILLRRFWTSTIFQAIPRAHLRSAVSIVVVILSGYLTGLMEAVTISGVPYYTFDPAHMYTVGSVFYGIYFYVSFPMFYRIDEVPSSSVRQRSRGKKGALKTYLWTKSQTAFDSLAGGMLAFIMLDLWRLAAQAFFGIDQHGSGLVWLE